MRALPGAAYEIGGVLKSRDGGQSWAIVGVPNTFITSLTLDPRQPSLLYAGTLGGMFRSFDGGESWPSAYLDGVMALAVDPGRSSTLYAAVTDQEPDYESDIYRSDDNGRTWAWAGRDVPEFGTLVIDPAAPDRLFGTGGGEAFESTDGGATWRVVRGLKNSSVGSLQMDPGDWQTFYAWGDGIYKSSDSGETWNAADHGLPDTWVQALAIDPRDSSNLYTATSRGVYRSTDGAAVWHRVNRQLVDARILAADPHTRGLLYAGTPDGVRQSRDGGRSWRGFSGGLGHRNITALLIDPLDPDILHAGTWDGGVYDILLRSPCVPDARTLCIDDAPGDRRFRVRLRFHTAPGSEGQARVASLAPLGFLDGGIMAFFSPTNPEVLVKVLNGCAINNHFWVFAAAATTVGYDLTVVDTHSTARRLYRNPNGQTAATIADASAFAACDAQAAARSAALWSPDLPPTEGRAPLPAAAIGSCVEDATTLCIDDEPADRRFRVRLRFETAIGDGASGDARATSLAPLGFLDGGIMAFFSPRNPEVLVKILDGCEHNGHFWVFAAAATTVGFDLVVEDTAAGIERRYTNPDLHAAETITDTQAFATCQ